MRTFIGTVRNGVVELPPRAGLRDGAKVVLAVLSDRPTRADPELMADLEAEDVAFVRACRGRLAEHMRGEEP